MSWLTILNFAAPLVLHLIPQLAPLAPAILTGIAEAEALPGASSADKQTHVVNLATAAIAATNTATGKQTIDPTIATTLVPTAINTIVSVTNLVHAAHGG